MSGVSEFGLFQQFRSSLGPLIVAKVGGDVPMESMVWVVLRDRPLGGMPVYIVREDFRPLGKTYRRQEPEDRIAKVTRVWGTAREHYVMAQYPDRVNWRSNYGYYYRTSLVEFFQAGVLIYITGNLVTPEDDLSRRAILPYLLSLEESAHVL